MTRPITLNAAVARVGEYVPQIKAIGWVLLAAAGLVYSFGAAGNRQRLDSHEAEIRELRQAVTTQAQASAETTRALNALTVRVGELVGEMRGLHRP